MTIDGPTNMFEGELAALQRSRAMESLNTSPVCNALSNIADVIGQFGVPGADLFARALKSGQTPVEKVVEQLENGAYAEIARIRKHLEGQDARLNAFEAQLRSQEAQSAYLGAVLHGLRTSDPRKHIRLGALTIDCLYADDLEPEGLDDMMRAAVELKARDILALGFICSRQSKILADAKKWPEQWYDNVRRDWQTSGLEQGVASQRAGSDEIGLKSTLSRLAAFGFIIAVPPVLTQNSPGKEPFALLHEGLRFYERIEETTA